MDKNLSKHLNTQKFIEFFNEHAAIDLINSSHYKVLMDGDETAENKLKAVSEINKYAMIPTQSELIRREVDEACDFELDGFEREELKKLLQEARGEEVKAKEGHEEKIEELLRESMRDGRAALTVFEIIKTLLNSYPVTKHAIEYVLETETNKLHKKVIEKGVVLKEHQATYTEEDYPF